MSVLWRYAAVVLAMALTGDVPGRAAHAQVDTTPPMVVAVSPVDGATAIPVTLDTVKIDFSEDMDTGSLLANTSVTEGTPAGSQLSVSFGVDLRVIFIRPNVQLEPGTAYFVHVLTGATDVAGNPLAAEFLSFFTTGLLPVETTPPTVVAVSPADGATNVPVTLDTIQIDFSEDMNRGGLLDNTFVTEGTPGRPPAVRFVWRGPEGHLHQAQRPASD